MKHLILSLSATVMLMVVMAQPAFMNKSAAYEAANWKTWLLDSVQQIKISAPPTAAQSQVELQSIQQQVSRLDKKNQKT